MAKLGKRTLARAAVAAVVKQADAAVWAEIGSAIFQIHETLATGSHALSQAPHVVVAQLLATLPVGHGRSSGKVMTMLAPPSAVAPKRKVAPMAVALTCMFFNP